uniref:REC114 meiotic recombination protein n=1 Tax=Cyanistes caeruleus TaxID=156563 RepID=A0A8C0U0F3_CYACU
MQREPPPPRADWRTIPATRSLRLPIGSCFPPSSRALAAAAPQSSQSGMAEAAGGGCGSEPGLASAPGSAGDTSLLGGATVWPLKRYGRFLPPKDGDDEGQNTSWKVFESNEESGPLVLTIVESGHFFISQERTVLEGFSLIDSHKWLKIVRRAECLLLQAQAKNECRMFRVQFGGSSKEEVQEHCCSCVQKLSEYIPVQGAEEQSQQLCHGTSQDTQGMDTEHAPDEPLPDSCTSLGERRSVAQLTQVKNKHLQSENKLSHSIFHLGNAFPEHWDTIICTSKTLHLCNDPEPGNLQQNKVFGGVITPFEWEQMTG